MGTSCTQLHMFYVADKSRESETGAYYSLYAFVCHFIFQSATNNTISSNILQYIAICNISIFSIGHIVLYCSSEYCNIAIFQYIVSPLVSGSNLATYYQQHYKEHIVNEDTLLHTNSQQVLLV